MKRRSWFFLTLTLPLCLSVIAAFPIGQTTADEIDTATEPVPVEDDMHEFMEYVFQPTYRSLKEDISLENEKNPPWGKIKSGALILAEGGNLLLMRVPEEDADDFKKHSVNTRKYAALVYRHAGKKEFKEARQAYEKMITSCNQCHEQFEDGRHILKP